MSWIEVRDSTGRCERGSFEYVLYHARKWMTTAFVAAHPDLIWLHAAAASMDGAAVLLAGPAGAGKSTLLVQLVEPRLGPAGRRCAWRFGRPRRGTAPAVQSRGESRTLAGSSRTGPISSRNRRRWRQSRQTGWRRSRRPWLPWCSPSTRGTSPARSSRR